MPRLFPILCATTAGVLLAAPAFAELLSTTSPTIRNDLCVGGDCASNESFDTNFDQLKLKDNYTRILLEDTSTTPGFPSNDWAIQANDRASSGEDQLMFVDETSGAEVMMIKAGAPSSTLVLDGDGRVGIGTELPQADLHVISNSLSKIRMQESTYGGDWELHLNPFGLALMDRSTLDLPFFVKNGAPIAALWIEDTGDVGLGTDNPDAPLHVRSGNTATDDNQGILVENTSATPGTRGLLTMRNRGGSYFTLDNINSGTTWYFVHEDAAPNRFIIADAVNDGPEMALTADGDLTVPGAFISGSTTLNVPDYVFEPDYDLKPLSEVSAFISENKHLPDVPSAADVARDGLDMTSMQMAQLKKIEELTLYILEQQAVIDAQARENAALAQDNAAQDARLARIEALLAME